MAERRGDGETSSQLRDEDGVHIIEGLIFSAHSPTESVPCSAGAGVHAPCRREHRLLRADKQVASFLRLSHNVQNALRRIEIEVHVNLAAAPMGVRRHGVPARALVEKRVAHDELTASDAIRVDAFVEAPRISRGLGAERLAGAAFMLYQLRWQSGMSGVADEIEAGRIV
jgi:hypothetical protein